MRIQAVQGSVQIFRIDVGHKMRRRGVGRRQPVDRGPRSELPIPRFTMSVNEHPLALVTMPSWMSVTNSAIRARVSVTAAVLSP